MKGPSRFVSLVVLMALGGLGCHVDRETSVNGPDEGTSEVIKFENLTRHGVLVRIADAHQEFELGVDEGRTVEVHSDDGIAIFFVEIYHSGYADISVAPRWTGFVGIGKRVTIQHISRVTISD
ncbi:hypothetical protein ACFL6X_09405 [Candidatus Latescibacterota bacterium]